MTQGPFTGQILTGIIYTQQSIDEYNTLTLFSTITHPRVPNKHCWTTGYIEGGQYILRSELADLNNVRRTEIIVAALPLPLTCESFIIPYPSPSLYLPSSHTTPTVAFEPGQYGSRTIPLPDGSSTGHSSNRGTNLHPTSDDSACELPAPVPTIPLQGAQLLLQSNPSNKRRHQGGEEEMPSRPQSYGTTGTCFWSTLSLDRGLDGSN